MKTRAAILWNVKQDWSVEEVELDPPKHGEVLVKLAASGMCHSDEHLYTGDLPAPLPCIGGHEGSGVILEVGEGVTDLEVGDHVVFAFMPACGRCRMCSTGHQNLCDLGSKIMQGGSLYDGSYRFHAQGKDIGTMCMLGTFAEHTVVNEASCVKIEKDIPLDKACLVGCGVTTGWGSAVYAAEIGPGDTVVVVGIGGIGMSAVQGARLAGARHIVAVDPVEFKREQAQEFGATHTAKDVFEAMNIVTEISWGQMADKVLITPGVVDGNEMMPIMALVSKNGRAVVTGLAPTFNFDVKMSLMDLTLMQKEIRGSLFGSANPRADIPKLLQLYRSGQLLLDEMITRTYPLDGVNQGYQDMRDGKNIRGVLVYD